MAVIADSRITDPIREMGRPAGDRACPPLQAAADAGSHVPGDRKRTRRFRQVRGCEGSVPDYSRKQCHAASKPSLLRIRCVVSGEQSAHSE